MKITNKYNVPEVIHKAVEYYINKRRSLEEGLDADYSVTQLLSPPTIAVLRKRHFEQIEKDVSDSLYVLQGNLIHQILEIASKEHISNGDLIIESPMKMQYEGTVISGCPDVYHKSEKKLVDYKYVGVKSAEKNLQNYYMQTNLYKILLEVNYFPVEKIEIVIFYRDWNKGASLSNADYPKSPVQIIPVPIYDYNEVLKFMRERLALIKQYKEMSVLLPCTPEERFQNDEKFAVMRPGNKKASKLCGTYDEAVEFIATKGYSSATIEKRESEPKRCLDYCDVNKFCPFYQEYIRTLYGEEI